MEETAKSSTERQKRRLGPVLLVGLLAVAAVAVTALWWPGWLRPAPTPEVSGLPVGYRVGQRAPDFTLPTFEGTSIALSDYRGRIVVLDFWASWCIPCRLTMPSLEAIAETYSEVTLLGVCLDRSRADAIAYLNSRENSSMVAVYGSLMSASAVSSTYGVAGIPRTFVIDQEGVVRFADHPANLSPEAIEALL